MEKIFIHKWICYILVERGLKTDLKNWAWRLNSSSFHLNYTSNIKLNTNHSDKSNQNWILSETFDETVLKFILWPFFWKQLTINFQILNLFLNLSDFYFDTLGFGKKIEIWVGTPLFPGLTDLAHMRIHIWPPERKTQEKMTAFVKVNNKCCFYLLFYESFDCHRSYNQCVLLSLALLHFWVTN